MHWFYHIVRYSLVHYGYWAVLAGLLIEDAGIPWPGETTLVFAAFVAHKNSSSEIGWTIVVGIFAAILGDNIGYFLGRKLGRHLLRWIKKIFHMDDEDIGAAKDMLKHHYLLGALHFRIADNSRSYGRQPGYGVEGLRDMERAGRGHLGSRSRIHWPCFRGRIQHPARLFREGVVGNCPRVAVCSIYRTA
jgi:membrane protein YqaA with SNARE-associated domain